MTLIEALVTTAVLVLLSALAFPALDRSAQSLAIAGARAQILGDMRAAQGTALAQDRPVTVASGKGGRDYRIDGVVHGLPDGLSLQVAGDRGAIIFYPDGTAAGGPVRIAARKMAVEISADAATGLVRMADARP